MQKAGDAKSGTWTWLKAMYSSHGCLAFEYDPGYPRPQPYCYNCRVVSHDAACRPKASGQNYTLYQRKSAPILPASPVGVLSYVEEHAKRRPGVDI